jgi:hypothetical protein
VPFVPHGFAQGLPAIREFLGRIVNALPGSLSYRKEREEKDEDGTTGWASHESP